MFKRSTFAADPACKTIVVYLLVLVAAGLYGKFVRMLPLLSEILRHNGTRCGICPMSRPEQLTIGGL